MNETDLQQELDQLKAENQKLKKINRVLMQRIEGIGGQSNLPYAMFEHSVHLSDQVQEKTRVLNQTLAELECSNRALEKANYQANIFKQRFIDAIESISDAFVLLDRDGRIILQNRQFSNYWHNVGLKVGHGTHLNDFKTLAKARGIISHAYPGDENNNTVYKLADNRWFQVTERRTREGGWVMLYTDITALKVAETARYEHGMAQKSKLLQNLVDNLSQGVILISGNGQIEVWNKQFVSMSGISVGRLRSSPFLENLESSTELDLSLKQSHNNQAYSVQTLANGTVIEVRNHYLTNGKIIKTYTDITSAHHYAQSLRESEHRLRLITDNIPAMIAYVSADLTFQFTNRVYQQWYGRERGDEFGVDLKNRRVSLSDSPIQPYVARVLNGESVSFEVEETNQNGEAVYLHKSYVPNIDSNGAILGFFVLIRDITIRIQNALTLQKAYDSLELRVNQRTADLQQLNNALNREIEERRLAQLNLTQAKKAAEQANVSKTKFVAAVSHDLLQPLNAAQLFTSSLKEEIRDQQNLQLLDSIAGSLDDLENLIGSLIDISKLDAGVVRADKHSFPLNELFDNLAREYTHQSSQYNIEFRYVPCNTVIHSDSVLLARILRNLLSNAFRYTEKGKVLLGCRRVNNTLSIQVWDSGSGIEKDQLNDIFKEFKRLESSKKTFRNGLGLGLAIVDKLAKVLEHAIEVHSQPGKGSMFSVTVPLGETNSISPSPAPLTNRLNASDLSGCRVWLIDNDLAVCEAMERLLANWQCDIVIATSFEDLQQKVDVNSDSVDVLIVDYHLNDNQNGLNVASKINANRKLPTLMITANYSEQLKNQANTRGIMLLHKPVKPMKLRTSIGYLINRVHR
ncbi:hybrid sensor histidine kinase/response regulator [Vibrio ponticus]|uniref:histidine kinase n=1 Tax=Vibrio ponticus TaxID=265668 RepID=A0ABX3F3F4_9VIBR|nr:NahK/ErcS family hybrid sensor histidine kinase/response regulator [Vibrio ponticus]OLQ84327.1 hybrid sensor histidine kinase/response regulator [Vibrio ponticus]